MQIARKLRFALVLVAPIALGGCGSLFKHSKKGTLTCSCDGTGCGCKHCRGDSTDCGCRATDAYSDGSVGDAGD